MKALNQPLNIAICQSLWSPKFIFVQQDNLVFRSDQELKKSLCVSISLSIHLSIPFEKFKLQAVFRLLS